jgi:hypothetical protein
MPKRRRPSKTRDPLANAVITELGGPTATARIFGIKPPSVMSWLEDGIPKARLMYLEVAYPQVMQKARKVKLDDETDRAAASDDAQPPVGGITKNTKLAPVKELI